MRIPLHVPAGSNALERSSLKEIWGRSEWEFIRKIVGREGKTNFSDNLGRIGWGKKDDIMGGTKLVKTLNN